MLKLYHDPPENSVVYCVDEKGCLQAREPLNREPMRPGRTEPRDPDYRRHGSIHMVACLNVHTGHVQGMFMSRSTNQEFKSFLEQIYDNTPSGKAIHIIADNLSLHKHKNIKQWLEAHPRVRMHFTPTHASWLNQIELWFSILQRQRLKRGVFTSIEDLIDQGFTLIKKYNQTTRPFQWTYKGKPPQNIKPRTNDTAH